MASENMTVEEVHKHIRVYLTVFAALAVLTVITVGVAYIHMPIVPALIVALIVASIKAGLVAGYFMHLIGEKKLIHSTLILTLVLFIAMVAIFLFAYYDQAQVGV